jgi:amidase
MSGFAEYDHYDALGLAELVRRGEVSPVELLEEAVDRRNRRNPLINAVVLDMDRQARATLERGLPQGPFTGVPFLIKDLLAAYAGVPMTSGSRAYRNYLPDFDSELVRRYKAGGVVIFGKTNTPELGLMGVTEPHLFGATRNPWNTERTPGGSSGGAAAAVAAGIVPMAGGGDGGGSLRIPAACCGLVGFKPTRGRNPHGPAVTEPWFGQVQEGVISRSVRDSAAMLDVTHGPETGALYAAPRYDGRFQDEVTTPPGRLRIAYTAQPLLREGGIDPECQLALDKTVRLLRELGHEVFEAAPALDRQALAEGYLMRIAAATAGDVRDAARVLGRKIRLDEFETETWSLARLGQSFSAEDLDTANRVIYRQTRLFDEFMQTCDVFLTPTLSAPPPGFGQFRLEGLEKLVAPLAKRFAAGPLVHWLPVLGRLAERNFQWVSSTPVMNMSGHPSVSLPLHWTSDNLPVGLMFTGRFGDDAGLFRLAGQLELAAPWFDRRPAQFAASGLK